MLSIKDWTSLVQSLVDSGCTISTEVKVAGFTHTKFKIFQSKTFFSQIISCLIFRIFLRKEYLIH